VNVQALEIHEHRRLAAHEGGHAAAALLLGLDVDSAHAPYWTLEDCLTGDPDEPAGQVNIPAGEWDRDPRSTAIAILAGPICDGRVDWPPKWPLTLAPVTPDDAQVGELVKRLDLDRAGYGELIQDAYRLTISRPFERLHNAVSHLLEQHGHIDETTLLKVKAIAEETSMQHKLLDVVDTEVDEGLMIALARTWEVDKVRDRVVPGAYAEAVAKIKSGDYLPLIFGHDLGSPGNFAGEIVDANETSEGLEVTARFDLDDADGIKAYKLVKRGSIKSLSIGYQVLKQRPAPGGITELIKIELHEVSLVLTPANPGARILAVKSDAVVEDEEFTLEDEEFSRIRAETYDLMTKAMSAGAPTSTRVPQVPTETLRQKADRIAREHAPIQIANFDC
jgi:HK97 family phage prohead protease